MYTFKFNIIPEDIDNHIRQNFSEEEKEYFANVQFIPCNVQFNDDLTISVTAVPTFVTEEVETPEEEQE